MPTYVYRFVDTGETIEVQQSFAYDALTEAAHPATGVVMPVKKVFTPVGVTFKGGGFYRTDSRSSSRSTSTATSGSSEKSDGSKSTDSKASESSSSSSSTSKASTSSDG
jgi:predicted nucleic acid-binding Zn ribbon protein